MSALTRSKIAYNLHISPHKLRVEYGGSESYCIEYVFSSELYKNKFMEKRNTNREQIEKSLSNRFGIEIKCDVLADLKLYRAIEKRGFLLYRNGVEVVCENKVTLDGVTLTIKSSDE